MPPSSNDYVFDVQITQRGDHYWVQVLDSPAGQSEEPFVLPFTTEELHSLAAQQLTQSGSPALEAAGTRLFDALFCASVGDCLRSSLAAIDDKTLRINLRFNNAAELAALPWELLYDPKQQRFLALSEQTPITRYLALPLPPAPLSVEPPLRVLAVLANPIDTGSAASVEVEWQNLELVLAGLLLQQQVVLERLDQPTWPALQNYLREHRVHVLHFVGHGAFDRKRQEGGLLFENEARQTSLVAGTQLAALLQNHKSLRLIVLNACDSAVTAKADLFAGVAQSLVRQGVPAVIAMQREISTTAVSSFNREFYAAIGDDYPVDAALTQARLAILAAGSDEWIVPVLFMRTRDGRLFERRQAVVAGQAQVAGQDAKPAGWHKAGAAWLAVGLLGLVLLAGLAQLLLADNALLVGAVAAMAALATFLAGILGLQGDKSLFPRASQAIGRARPVQAAMGGVLLLSLLLWGVIGLPRIGAAACDEVLGCKQAGEQWFAIGQWEPLTDDLSPYEQILIKSTPRILYDKLSQAPGLTAVASTSPQVNDTVLAELDIWVEGDYQRLGHSILSATINRRGQFIATATAEGDLTEVEDETAEVCLLDLQNQLALAIVEALQIETTTSLREAMRNQPTNSCGALKLNNEAAELLNLNEPQNQARNVERAMILLEQALRLDPDYADAHNNLGRAYYLQGDYAAARDKYRQALELQENYPVYHANLASVYDRQGEYDAAVHAYQRAIELDPTYAVARNNLGFLYLQRNALAAAEEQLRKGLAINSSLPALHKNMGRVLLAQDKPAAALDELQQAVTLFPNYVEAYYYLALAQHALDQTAEACDILRSHYFFDAGLTYDPDPSRADQAMILWQEWQCA